MSDSVYQQCVSPACASTYGVDEALFSCSRCGGLLDVRYDWSRLKIPDSLKPFEARRGSVGSDREARLDASGVWRFRELLPFADLEDLVTIGEGRTLLQPADGLASTFGMAPGRLFLQYEGFNPSGSFKDNGMAAAFTMARHLDRQYVACASTGNTSASLAVFAGQTATRSGKPMRAIVFVGDEKIAYGKLAQALDHGARTLQVQGDFDTCMRLVTESAKRLNLYLMNSVNPFRLEGQKAIMYRVLEALNWDPPDWIIVPGGNLGNSSAFGKAFIELQSLGLVKRVPRLAIINASGANTLCELYNDRGLRFNEGRVDHKIIDDYYRRRNSEHRVAKTIASAIEIGVPVNLIKALRSLEAMAGVVREVSDEAILEGKALVGRYGFGCEPASGASVAGLQKLLAEGIVSKTDRVVCILTGHALKDPSVTVNYHSRIDADRPELANAPTIVEPNVDRIAEVIGATD